MSIEKQPYNIFQLKWLLKLNKCTFYLCASTLKWLLLLLYTHPHPSFLGNFLHLGPYVYSAFEKIPTNIFMSFSSKFHVEHNQRGVGG